jgi:hypothetical protein
MTNLTLEVAPVLCLLESNKKAQTRAQLNKTMENDPRHPRSCICAECEMHRENAAIAAKEQAEARRSAEAGSVSVGVGQHAAAALWKTFKEHERTYVDMLEAAACLIVNVADKTESTDHEILTYVWKLTTDMRANAARSGKPNA